eukprot:scaffold33847_cov48-Phaeocystis_antarctica.AAC.1
MCMRGTGDGAAAADHYGGRAVRRAGHAGYRVELLLMVRIRGLTLALSLAIPNPNPNPNPNPTPNQVTLVLSAAVPLDQ